MYSLKTSINYFTEKGSNVFVAFMDLSKAFDKISHYSLSKLMKRNIPLCFIAIIIYWYQNMSVALGCLKIDDGCLILMVVGEN